MGDSPFSIYRAEFACQTTSLKSRDPNLHIIQAGLLSGTARLVLIFMLNILLFIPVIVAVHLQSTVSRLAVVLIAATTFTSTLSLVGKAKTVDLFIGSAT